jgi:hypothetical protein
VAEGELTTRFHMDALEQVQLLPDMLRHHPRGIPPAHLSQF